MPDLKEKNKQSKPKAKRKKGPPAKMKLAEAMRMLLANKHFSAITTEEIASAAGANEALIYRYFGDKRGLLHYVLKNYMEGVLEQILKNLEGVSGSLEKILVIVDSSFASYFENRIFAKIVLVEVRNFPGYFESDTYELVRSYARLLEDTIKKGVSEGTIRNDVPPNMIRAMIIGGIEHIVLPVLFFDQSLSWEAASHNFKCLMLSGIANKKRE